MWAEDFWPAGFWASDYWSKGDNPLGDPFATIAVVAIYDNPAVQAFYFQPGVVAIYDNPAVQAGSG